MTLRAALVAGPMYDHLYELISDDVEIVVHEDHPTLNREVARLLEAGERLDIMSTHSKYAPSQRRWLRPLDDLIRADAVGALASGAVELCRFEGTLLSAPRLIDVRVLWARSDRVEAVPDSWTELVDSGLAFGFPGRESGLFGTFFELVVSHGGRLFDDDARPTMASPEAEHAVELLCRLAAHAPDDLPSWHYDQVDNALLAGRIDAAAAWPGGAGPIRSSALADVLRPHPYPRGPHRRVSYAGCHSWAIPATCGDVPGATALLHRLISAEGATLDAAGGNVAAHVAAFAAVAPVDEVDARRLEITRDTIAEAMITYPPLERFPEVEDAGWELIRAALVGEVRPTDVPHRLQETAETVLA